jgi:hypothetical protein
MTLNPRDVAVRDVVIAVEAWAALTGPIDALELKDSPAMASAVRGEV